MIVHGTPEIFEDKRVPGVWRVEQINMKGEGECRIAQFSGPTARKRAEIYALLMKSQ